MTNGPTPIIAGMFAEVAPKMPMPRLGWGESVPRTALEYHTAFGASRRKLAKISHPVVRCPFRQLGFLSVTVQHRAGLHSGPAARLHIGRGFAH